MSGMPATTKVVGSTRKGPLTWIGRCVLWVVGGRCGVLRERQAGKHFRQRHECPNVALAAALI